MSKKGKFYTIIALMVIIALFYVYISTRPQDAVLYSTLPSTTDLSGDTVNEFVYEKNEPVCLFFYNSDEPESRYVLTSLLDSIKAENNLDVFESLYYVDLKDYESSDDSASLKASWGFSRTPAFLVMTIQDSSVQTEDVLQWDPENPFTVDDVRNWLKDHSVL